jgi:plastocyanin
MPGRTRRRLLAACGACLAATAGCTESRSSTPTLTPASVPEPVVVEVGPGGAFAFRPGTDEPLRVPTGTTVRFVWRSDNHSVLVTDQPDGGSWGGTPGSNTATYDEGYVHEHTFEVPGRYLYECFAHTPVGSGEVRVVER